jgi:hypothetical protein
MKHIKINYDKEYQVWRQRLNTFLKETGEWMMINVRRGGNCERLNADKIKII